MYFCYFIFQFIGLLLSGIAAWIIVKKQEVQSLEHVVLSPVILLLVVGIIIIATALIGCIGASCDKLWPLRIVSKHGKCFLTNYG